MAEENVSSETSQTAGGDETGEKIEEAQTQQIKEPEKVEITKAELEAFKEGDEQKTQEIERLKNTIYSEDYVKFLQSKGAPQAQVKEESWEFLPQKELHDRIMNSVDNRLKQYYLTTLQQQQEVSVAQQIKNAQAKFTDYDAMRPAMRKIAQRIGGNLSAEDAYRLAKEEAGEPIQLRRKTVFQPKPTEKPTTSSGTMKKTDFSEKEAIEEAMRRVNLEKALEEQK